VTFLLTSLSTPLAHAAGQSLEQAADDPTASLMSLQIADWYNFKYHNSDTDDNAIVLRAAYPFKIGEQKHIMRVTMPFVTDSPVLANGLSDTTIFDLMVFDASWGRWGVGAVALLATGGSMRGADQWAIGPALGFTAQAQGFLWGLFNQNLFSFAGDEKREEVKVSTLQPIINYSLPDKWSIGASEMNITYDWVKSNWTVLPLGVKVAKLVKFGKLPVQFSGSYEYNFQDDFAAPKWGVNFTVKFLFPI